MRSSGRGLWMLKVPALLTALLFGDGTASQEPRRLEIGRSVTEAELAIWNIDVRPDGSGLPPGQGTVAEGESIYDRKCLACHGAEGQGQPMDRLVGGQGTLTTQNPVKTIGSYWPYATTLFDYIRRAMPLDRPQSLTPDEVYALTAYLLHLNDLVERDAVMDADSLPMVQMPARSAYRGDPRPDVFSAPDR